MNSEKTASSRLDFASIATGGTRPSGEGSTFCSTYLLSAPKSSFLTRLRGHGFDFTRDTVRDRYVKQNQKDRRY